MGIIIKAGMMGELERLRVFGRTMLSSVYPGPCRFDLPTRLLLALFHLVDHGICHILAHRGHMLYNCGRGLS